MSLYEQQLIEIKDQLTAFRSKDQSLFLSSSFQTHSIPMLHIFSRFAPDTPVYFLNTGYHFPETHTFKNEIGRLLHLEIRSMESSTPKSLQRTSEGNALFTADTDYCCFLNKTSVMQQVAGEHDVWVSGVRRDQNANRRNMQVLQETGSGTLRWHPMLDWDARMIHAYRKEFGLPAHPLEKQGYLSVGCEPCTRKYTGGDGRSNRWFGSNKTECGLHTDLIKK